MVLSQLTIWLFFQLLDMLLIFSCLYVSTVLLKNLSCCQLEHNENLREGRMKLPISLSFLHASPPA